MDAQSFLLKREALVQSLRTRRQAILQDRRQTHRFMGLGWREWLHLFLGSKPLGAVKVFESWGPKLIFSVALPLLMGLVRKKGFSFRNERGLWDRLWSVFSFAKSRS